MEKEYIKVDRQGSKFYYKDPEMTILHREDGPAIEHYERSKQWWLNGATHRLDGPAIERSWGLNEWWVNGVYLFTVSAGTEDKIVDKLW